MASIGALDSLPQEVFMVWDTFKGEYWSNSKGKKVWLKSAHAKNAWNAVNFNRRGRTTFREQDRFVVHRWESNGWNRDE